MDFQVIFRDTFLADLEELVRRISIQSPQAGQRFGETIVSAGEDLRFFPQRHPTVRQRPGIRRFVIKKYFKVFYCVDSENKIVEILRLWDGRRGTDPDLRP